MDWAAVFGVGSEFHKLRTIRKLHLQDLCIVLLSWCSCHVAMATTAIMTRAKGLEEVEILSFKSMCRFRV